MIEKREIANDLFTLRDLIRWGTSQFNAAELNFVQGMPTAIDEAVYLCLSGLHLPPDFSAEYFDCVLTMDERLHVLSLFQQRIEQHKPAAYITHEAWFAGLSFYVDERVLIPRSPMAEIIQQQFSMWVSPDQVKNILDLCTGSACIAIACAYAFEQADVDACDISADALAVADELLTRRPDSALFADLHVAAGNSPSAQIARIAEFLKPIFELRAPVVKELPL